MQGAGGGPASLGYAQAPVPGQVSLAQRPASATAPTTAAAPAPAGAAPSAMPRLLLKPQGARGAPAAASGAATSAGGGATSSGRHSSATGGGYGAGNVGSSATAPYSEANLRSILGPLHGTQSHRGALETSMPAGTAGAAAGAAGGGTAAAAAAGAGAGTAQPGPASWKLLLPGAMRLVNEGWEFCGERLVQVRCRGPVRRYDCRVRTRFGTRLSPMLALCRTRVLPVARRIVLACVVPLA